MTPNRMVETALSIASELGAQSVWHENRCNWLSQTSDIFLGKHLPAAGMCGPNLYDGTAGTALFMAECYHATFDPVIKRYAEGAMSHALSRIEDLPERFAFGVYTGRTGVALAALRVGLLTDRPDFHVAGLAILNDLFSRGIQDHCIMDVMVGMGGAIPAVLSVLDQLEPEPALEALMRWGEALVSAAKWDENGASWDTMAEMQAGLSTIGKSTPSVLSKACCKPHLLGYAHGASGIGLALLELAVATGEAGFRTCAEAAIHYETAWFDQESGHWPDLRREIGDRTAPVAWCHGAAGIGLTRLRLWELTGEEMYRDQARLAVSLTIEAIVRSKRQDGNWSLCHGLLGNLETLIMAEDSLGTSHADTISDVLDFGRAAFTDQRRSWVYDSIAPEPLPGLMLGSSGTGYMYLRAAAKDRVPSVLRIGPTSKAAPVHASLCAMTDNADCTNNAGILL